MAELASLQRSVGAGFHAGAYSFLRPYNIGPSHLTFRPNRLAVAFRFVSSLIDALVNYF